MKSLEEVIIENKNLILKLASKYSRYYSIEDLYQVGIIGIIKAYDHYNKESNSKFSTYAYKYILGEMIDYIRKDRNIIVSEEYFKIYKKYLEVRRLLETKLNREVTLKEISDFIGIGEEEIVRILEYVSFTKSIDKEISYEYYVDERENIDTKIYLETLLDSGAREIFSDEEMLNTAEEFLENNLNVSETSRKLYLHRNTLPYRLDKIEKATGLNIRKFSDAVTFRLITILSRLVR